MNINKEELKNCISPDRYYADQLGTPVRSNGKVDVYFCPNHLDRETPNLTVYPDGGHKCFTCGAGGDIFSFHQRVTHLTFKEALSDLASQYAPHLLRGKGDDILLNKAKPKSLEDRKKQEPLGEPVEIYPYENESEETVLEVLRYEPKTFRQRRPDGKGGWIWNLQGVKTVLYRLPEVLAHSGAIHICEGEKDVDL
jgi:hypothetical protein